MHYQKFTTFHSMFVAVYWYLMFCVLQYYCSFVSVFFICRTICFGSVITFLKCTNKVVYVQETGTVICTHANTLILMNVYGYNCYETRYL